MLLSNWKPEYVMLVIERVSKKCKSSDRATNRSRERKLVMRDSKASNMAWGVPSSTLFSTLCAICNSLGLLQPERDYTEENFP